MSAWSTAARIPWPAWITTPASPAGVPVFSDRLSPTLDPYGFRLHLASVPDARALDRQAFQAAVREAYRSLDREMTASACPHAVRYWSFIPGIDDMVGPGLDRYMAFNEGRFAAFSERTGGDGPPVILPTASGIGNDDNQLVIGCLSATTPGTPVENPRQTSAYRYSARFGPRPPCFARATRIAGAGHDVLLVGGTASITGEDSRHDDDLERQIDETLLNLAAVVSAAEGDDSPDLPHAERLAQYRHLRVYLPRRTDPADVEARLSAAFPTGIDVEWRRAELCRRELLVEIEGVALITPASS
ncbi:MAG: pteridine-dependent deoxygenase like protein [Acidobacteria bacterium]|nr:pteridine-dependent deoxygenase like protein [Acidobacteriota bacterium]